MVKSTVLQEEQEAFPRGRPGHNFVKDVPADGADGSGSGRGRQERSKKPTKGVEDDSVPTIGPSGTALVHAVSSVRRLRYDDLAEGTLLLAAVRDVTKEELVVDLPFQHVGYASAAHATEPDALQVQEPDLTELYWQGQLVTVVVLAVLEVGPLKRHRIEVSLRPSLVNAGLELNTITAHMLLPAVIKDEEEHVLRLGFGIEGIQGILKKTDIEGLPRKPGPGMVLQVSVRSINTAAKTVLCGTKAEQVPPTTDLNASVLKPGFLVLARVEKVLPALGKEESAGVANNGLVASFCGALTGVVHSHQQGDPAAGALAHRAGQRLAARVLAVVPGTPCTVHLTMAPHLLDWSQDRASAAPLAPGERVEAEVLEIMPSVGCRLRCSRPGTPAEGAHCAGFCAVSRMMDPAEDGVAVMPRGLALGARLQCRVLWYNSLDAVFSVTARPRDMREGALISVEELAAGQLVVGTISRVADFGVFVEISDYLTGLIHLRHLTDVPLATVPNRFKEGAKIKCRVLQNFRNRRQLCLTAKKSMVRSSFQLTDISQARENMLVTGFVSSIKPAGAFVSFYSDVFGLIPAEEMERAEAPAAGMTVQCRIAKVFRTKQRLRLSLNLENGKDPADFAGSEPAQDPRRPFPGAVVSSVQVVQHTEDGLVVRFCWRTPSPDSGGADDSLEAGFIPTPHLADDLGFAKARQSHLAGSLGAAVTPEEVHRDAVVAAQGGVPLGNDAVVLDVAPREGARFPLSCVVLSSKPSLLLAAAEGDFVHKFADLQESRLYTGYVTEVREFGALVSLGYWRLTGVAPKHQIAEHFVNQPNEELLPGQTVRVRVSKLQPATSRFMADLRAATSSAAEAPLLHREAESLRLLFQAQATLAEALGEVKNSVVPGSVLEATVTAVKDYGVLLSISSPAGPTALALKENIPKDARLGVGDTVKCAVLDFDPATGIADVSLQPELVAGDPLKKSPGGKKKRKQDDQAAVFDQTMLQESKQVLALPALAKPAYSVLWSKEPPAVLFAPPFGQRSRRWAAPRAVVVHSVPQTGDVRGRVVVRFLCDDVLPTQRVRVPRILRPAEELHVGGLVALHIRGVKGVRVLCSGHVRLRGYVHATQFVDKGPLGSPPVLPLQNLPTSQVLEGRILQMQEVKKGKLSSWKLNLTCRPSLMEARDLSDYEAAIAKWSSMRAGRQVVGVVTVVEKQALWLEVAPGIQGRVVPLDASANLAVVQSLQDHFEVGQVFQSRVVRSVKSQKQLDLALHNVDIGVGAEQSRRTVVRLSSLNLTSSGKAVSFQLPGNQRGFAHITELFDVWVELPLQKLKVGSFYEAYVLDPDKDHPNEWIELSLRPSLVHNRPEGPTERRPLVATALAVGQTVSGYVIGSGPKGVFVELSRSLVGYISLKNLSENLVQPDAVSRLHPAGQLIRDAIIISIDAEKNQAILSLKQGGGGANTALSLEQFSVGDVVSCEVKVIQSYGLFARIDNSRLDAFIHRSQISDSASVSVESFKRGQRIKHAKVIKIENGKISLGIKASLFAEGELDDEDNAEEIGEDAVSELEAEPDNLDNSGAHHKHGRDAPSEAVDQPPLKKNKKHGDDVPTVQSAADEVPWSQPIVAVGAVPDAAAAFEFAEFRVASPSGSEDEEHEGADSDNDAQKRPTKRQKKALKTAEAKELQKQEAENAEGLWATDPQSVEDFERLLLTQGDTSIVWIRYMAFHLKMSDLERARQVAERAVKHVGFSEAKERFNVWVAYMNLECTFGTDEKAEAVFRRAASHNDAKQVHLQLARIHQRNNKISQAVNVYEACCRKFAHSKKVWLALIAFLYQQYDLEGARKTLPRSLAALPRRKHPMVVSKAALLEYQYGSPERGRSIFEGLLDSYPKRTDLWSVYIDAHIKAYTPPKVAVPQLAEVRSLLERCCTMKLKVVKMRFFFKKWLDFEKRWGDAESQERVRLKAREFVESQAV